MALQLPSAVGVVSPVWIPEILARVGRGRYLVEHVASCFSCHPRTEIPGPAAHFGPQDGFPGDLWAPNLTSDPGTGLGNWTDGQVLRAIREGVDNDHEALAPIMPYRSRAQRIRSLLASISPALPRVRAVTRHMAGRDQTWSGDSPEA